MNERNKPVTEIRYGAVKAAIWRYEGESGPRFSATFSRIYRDGDQWKTAESFGRDELLLLAKVADEAHTWIHAQARATGPATGRDGAPEHGGSSSPAAPRGAAGGRGR